MTRVGRALIVIVAMGAGVRVFADDPSAVWHHWRYSAPIAAASVTSARLVGVVVPDAVAEKAAPGESDLRVVDETGREVPFELRVRRGLTEAVWRDATVLEPSAVAGEYTQATIDTGAASQVHNALRLDLSTTGDFLSWVEVSIGDDGRSWRVLRDRAPVYDLRGEGMNRAVDVTYPDSVSRFLRVRILDGTRRYRIASASVAFERTTRPDLAPADAHFVLGDVRPHRTTWVSSADVSGAWISEVRFEHAPDAFDRPAQVETSDDGREWQVVAADEIYRMTDHGRARESLVVRVPETRATHWRITVDDRNDAPLAGIQPVLYASPRRVVFRQEPGRTYVLRFGNAKAAEPEYDFARLTDAEAIDAAASVALGEAQADPDYEDPAPWTEKHPLVLWSAVGLAVLAMGSLALGTLRSR